MSVICKYCHCRIVEVNYALGKRWVHQEAGRAFEDGMYEFCMMTVATP